MKVIILAAGEGSRLRPFTNTVPKPLIKIFGKTIIEHNLESIYKYVSEIVIVVKYKKEMFYDKLGDNYKGTKVTYFEQTEKKGTAGALYGITIEDKELLILNGDNIFEKNDLEKLINFDGYGVLVKQVEQPEKYGIFELDGNDYVKSIIEKPETFVGNLANLGVYKFNLEILEIIKNVRISKRGEYEITDAINEFAKIFPLKAIKLEGEFIDVGYPWDILTANSYFLDRLETSRLEGIIEENVVIKGNIILEKGAILKSGTYIEGNCYIGKNTNIGPNIYLRGYTCIGDNCHLGANNEIKNSSIGDNTNIAHLSYIGDSIIGNHVNIGGGFISANLRHDKTNIKVPIKGVLTDTCKYKLGVIIGDNCKTGINTSSMPGRIIQNDTFTNPGEIIK